MNKHHYNIGILALLLLLASSSYVIGQPGGATIVSNTTDTPAAAPAGSLTTAGGSFTTLLLNATTQNPRWKAYVGNISGELSLRDTSSQTIYDWDLSVITGEVYASRNNSIDWSSIACANRTTIISEDQILNISTNKVDTINKTFNDTVHQGFYVGNTFVANSTCPAIATYVNSQKQAASESADFQEILLQDSAKLVYATILENDAQSYDTGATFDFQMILAENEFNQNPTTYYFFAELG